MSRSYKFDGYRIIPASRELWHGDRLIALPPQVFDCLTYLVERHDRAVGRDELVAAVWGETEISDTLLGQTILRIRREIGDDAKAQRALRTIPRFGYRWVAPLDIAESGATAPASTPQETIVAASAPLEPAAPPAPTVALAAQRRPSAPLLGAALALVLVAGAALWTWRSHAPTPAPESDAAGAAALTSAVLPAAVEPGADWAWTRLGVMDVVASRLRSGGLPSVPSESVVTLLNTPAANRGASLRDTLAARLLVTPHVRRDDSGWQVDLDADDGHGQHFAVDAHASEVTAAARAATDKLLVALGREPAGAPAEADPDSALVRRIDAAVLADDPDGARALIAQASPEQQRSPEVRLRLAKIDFRGGRLDAARERLDGLLAEAPANTAPVLRASVLNGVGAVAIRSDKPQQAELAFTEAIALLESQHDPAQLGQAYLGRAAAASDQHHYDAAATDFARARVALRQANDTLALIRVAADEGFIDLDQGRPAQALQQLRAATEGFKQWGALNEAILTYVGEIGCHLALLDNSAAMQAADAAAALAQRIDNPATLASLTLARARALAAVGRLREARASLDELRSTTTDATTAAHAGVLLARLELDANNASAAADLAEHTVAVLDHANQAGARAEAWLTAIRADLRAGNGERAAQAIAALDQWAAQSDEPRARLFARLADAEYARQFGAAGQWRSAFVAARDLATRDAIPYEVAVVVRSYSDALFAERDYDAAAVEVGRVTRWADRDFACAVLEARLYAAMGRNEARQTAVARARALAGERRIPDDALATPVSTRAAAH
jgi:DNA-binding winged helix-turn-helix (wHTH) protein